MSKKGKEILSKFIADEKTSKDELRTLQQWLSDKNEVNRVFEDEWNKADEKETEVKFSSIRDKIKNNEKTTHEISGFRKLLFRYQKIAAVLLLPVIVLSIYFAINQFNTEPTYFQTSAERGQKSKVVLPDGTKVWLNSDTKIIYPDNFGKRNRNIQLFGEAYFEVAKNANSPFFVYAGEVKVKVLGTTFNLKAYPDESEIETTLFEGKVELTVQPKNQKIAARTVNMKPGESLVFSQIKNELKYGEFESEEILAWTNNQLIFRNDNFENLARKIERWYNVEIVYDEASLNDQRLTVELYQGELLFRLLDIIELAMDVECISEKDKIYIKSKK